MIILYVGMWSLGLKYIWIGKRFHFNYWSSRYNCHGNMSFNSFEFVLNVKYSIFFFWPDQLLIQWAQQIKCIFNQNNNFIAVQILFNCITLRSILRILFNLRVSQNINWNKFNSGLFDVLVHTSINTGSHLCIVRLVAL